MLSYSFNAQKNALQYLKIIGDSFELQLKTPGGGIQIPTTNYYDRVELEWEHLIEGVSDFSIKNTGKSLVRITGILETSSSSILGDEHVHASILVRIFGDKFDFSLPAYQIKSSAIHFEAGEGNTIHRHQSWITLEHLFNSVGVKLDEQCYIFPDGRQFCTIIDYSLKFYINDNKVSDIRNYVVKDGDRILISYGNENQAQIQKQFLELEGQQIEQDSSITQGVTSEQTCRQYGIPKPTLNPIPRQIYAGQTVTFSGTATCNGLLVANLPITILEHNPFSQLSYTIVETRTNSNGEFSIDWFVLADDFEKELEIQSVYYIGDGSWMPSKIHKMTVLRYSSAISLDKFPSSAEIGDMLIFTGNLKLESGFFEDFKE